MGSKEKVKISENYRFYSSSTVASKIFYSPEGYSIARLRLILQLLKNVNSRSNVDISANIEREWTSCILKFKLIYSEYKDICLVAIALIFSMLCEIKEEYFFGTPAVHTVYNDIFFIILTMNVAT